MDEKILATIVISPKKNEFIKGPIISLNKREAKILVEHFKFEDKWSNDYFDENTLEIDEKVLFHQYKILPIELNDPSCTYYFDIYNIGDFFGIQNFKNCELKAYAIKAISKQNSSNTYIMSLGPVSSKILLESIGSQRNNTEDILLTETDIRLIKNRQSVKELYLFDNNLFDYKLVVIDLAYYIFNSSERWFRLNKLSFLPLNYILN